MQWLTKLGMISLVVLVAGCGAFGGKDGATNRSATNNSPPVRPERDFQDAITFDDPGETIWDAFGGSNAEQTVQVNRYLWSASLDVLNFLPVQSVDPFTGLIITGYGTPPGGGRSYRATVHIKDPALDARSLNLSLHSKGGTVSAATTRAVEDAIFSRARQLRIADKKL
ncbi:DUF3576 domain-containing protein [Parasedimentitalea psychrophila]|uniref:DUF3576 domain-containing protein n=2 Tax=Parasedimentitalea psychrophila TaxID=2997337 RepID=A0A9Y2L3M7_9RHOB|nr:DUF3576 domain-containing protein [Parasedimentitalea psychrophila]WIY26982.1 DUF3576 domain-containing protein [Parasedimentitalea psychrophila]